MKHAYWRRPDAQLHKSDDLKHAPVKLFEKIGVTARVTGNQISWQGMEIEKTQTAAYSSIGIIDREKNELNQVDTRRIVRTSVNELIVNNGGETPVCPNMLINW